MEVVVTEEKKKIFRARKTMKISDRQQLEVLHTTLMTAGSSEPSPPPQMNGTHKEDGQKIGENELNTNLDPNSPLAESPASQTSLSSPAPFLSLSLSPSPVPSQSPKAKDESASSPTSPFHSLNFELKKMEEEEKRGSPSSPLKDSLTSAERNKTESKERKEKDKKMIPEPEVEKKKVNA